MSRDTDVQFKVCGTKYQAVLNPIEAETRAVLLSYEFAVMSGIQNVIIESDAEKVIKMLTDEKIQIPWRLLQIFNQIRAQSRKLNAAKFSYIKRDGNSVAHSLEKYALSNH